MMPVRLEPGPIDPTVLTRQASHRSAVVWDLEGPEDSVALTCRRREASFRRVEIDERLVPFFYAAGFGGLLQLPFIQLDWHLITALVERWRPETHTFHMPTGETTITLQDVSIQLGLRVDGRPVVGRTDYNWHDECQRLLGATPEGKDLDVSRVSLRWLESGLGAVPVDANDDTLRRHARAHILRLIGGTIFSDKSSHFINLMFLPLLEELEQGGEYSWGSAALGWLYRDLCRATVPTAHEIGGCLILLQIWAWDRFPYIAPLRRHLLPVQPGPLITRWHDIFSVVQVSTHVVRQYRFSLDRMTSSQVVWQPYSADVIAALPAYCRVGSEVWQAVAPLLCFPVAEWHQPDRVLRQFGQQQEVPGPSESLSENHIRDLRTTVADWSNEYAPLLALWEQRLERVVTGPTLEGDVSYHDPYFVWYRSITRRYISRVACTFDFVTKCLEEICRSSDIQSDAYTLAAEALRAQDEHHRLVGLGVSRPPPAQDVHHSCEEPEVATQAEPAGEDVLEDVDEFEGVEEHVEERLVGESQEEEELHVERFIEMEDRGQLGGGQLGGSGEEGTQGPEGVTQVRNVGLPISWPSDSVLTQSWVISLMEAFDWGSRHLSPSEFPSLLPLQVFENLVRSASELLHNEPNIVSIDGLGASSIVVVGDVHGQLHDLIFLLGDAGFPADDKIYVFNGDYVDRGAWGLETFLLLLAWKVCMPLKVYLLRGNHESDECASKYGFKKEVFSKYENKGKHVYNKCLGCFKELPLASIIAGSVYTAHGGLFRRQAPVPAERSKRRKTLKATVDSSPALSLGSLDDLVKARRTVLNPPWKGPNLVPGDVLWSDPSMSPGLSPNVVRGMGLLWGPDCTEAFLKQSNLKLIIRAHEGPDARKNRPGLGGMDAGYTIDHVVESGKLITLFSAPDYPQFQATEERSKNKGAYIVLEHPHFNSPVFHSFKAITPRPNAEPYYDYDVVTDSDEEQDYA